MERANQADYFLVGEVEELDVFGHIDFLFRGEDSPFIR
jgi:hypothetical protein